MAHLGWLTDLEPLLDEQKLPDSSAALLRTRLGKDEANNGDEGKNGKV